MKEKGESCTFVEPLVQKRNYREAIEMSVNICLFNVLHKELGRSLSFYLFEKKGSLFWVSFVDERCRFRPDHTPDSSLCLTSRDLGVGNGPSPQLASDNDRALENMPVVLHSIDTDKVKRHKCLLFISNSISCRCVCLHAKCSSVAE